MQQTAIATSLDLRCYAVLTPRHDPKVELEVPDISFEQEWDINELPWSFVAGRLGGTATGVVADKELDEALIKAIEGLVVREGVAQNGAGAAVAFLYLYMVMAGTLENA
jgi:hypothetical protein